jgi:hypothetical protein
VCFEGCTGLAPARGCCVSTLRRGFCFPSPQHWAPKIVAWCVRHSWCFGTASVPAPVPAWRATKVAGLVGAASRTSVAPHTNGNGSRSESAGSDSQLPSPEEPCQIGYKHPKACRLGPARAPRRKVTGVTSKPIQFGPFANNDTRPNCEAVRRSRCERWHRGKFVSKVRSDTPAGGGGLFCYRPKLTKGMLRCRVFSMTTSPL